jgi:membrane protease YdiL (CAAX protease family)
MTQTIKTIGRIILALILGVFVLGVGSSVSLTVSRRFPNLVRSLPMGEGFIIQICFLVLSILLILAISRGDFSRYGFRIGKNFQLIRIMLLGLIVGIAGTLIGALAPDDISVEPEFGSFINLVIGVWILASIAEEVFTRGLIQGFLGPLAGSGFTLRGLRISLPVLISALFFGLMHLGVLSTGANLSSVLIIVIFAFMLGIIAGYYREKSESLIPAIIIHMCGNVGGWLGDLILNL